MELRRTFSGSLASNAEFLVAPKVSGRVEYMAVDIGDPVLRKQEVARLDNDEYIQAVAQAKADLAVADADLTGAENARDIAKRELSRMETLKNRGCLPPPRWMRPGQRGWLPKPGWKPPRHGY